jgi:hypothetical protein
MRDIKWEDNQKAITELQDELAKTIEVAISENNDRFMKELTDVAKQAKELHRSTTISSQDAGMLFKKWLQQLRTGEEITLEGNFLETRKPDLNKPIEKFAFRKGISNVK